jgi:predicted amidohydrolase
VEYALANTNFVAPLRIAIGQLNMCWSGEENTRAIVRALALAAAQGAQVCVFPELAITGFHRQIRSEAQPERVQMWLRRVQEACAAHAIAASLGLPTFGQAGAIYNSNVFIDASGTPAGTVEKNGLTPAEETFFTRGTARPVHAFMGHACSVVLCREIEDLAQVSAQLPHGAAQLLFWPGAMRPAVDGSETDPEAIVKRGQAMARATGAYLIQANWPNSLNYPQESTFAGQSVVIDSSGTILLRLPVAQPGVAVFTLGSADYAWHAQEADSAQLTA